MIDEPNPGARGLKRRRVRAALSWLTVGSLVPFLGWLYGVVLLWRSPEWTVRDKIIGTLCFPFGFVGTYLSVSYGFYYFKLHRKSADLPPPYNEGRGLPDVEFGVGMTMMLTIVLPVMLEAFGPVWLATHADPPVRQSNDATDPAGAVF